ncbi:MAG TPA: cupredoxin domain-containing protein [Candidatus Dormibacteraeota bacterium]|nr:cupredoxin domain-containing protein [Candidatus Dormibacteraeota bacterium]
MHRVRVLAIALATVALAACSSTSATTWTYAPASPATPVASAAASGAAASGASGSAGASGPAGSAASSGSPTTSFPASVAPSGGAASPSEGGGSTIELAAQGIAYDKASLQVPASQPFTLKFHNADAGVPHNVDIKDASGTSVFKGEIFSGDDTRSYQVPSLPAGNYTFMCDVHPNMTGTLVAGS